MRVAVADKHLRVGGRRAGREHMSSAGKWYYIFNQKTRVFVLAISGKKKKASTVTYSSTVPLHICRVYRRRASIGATTF